jgi:hypothetical protein
MSRVSVSKLSSFVVWYTAVRHTALPVCVGQSQLRRRVDGYTDRICVVAFVGLRVRETNKNKNEYSLYGRMNYADNVHLGTDAAKSIYILYSISSSE